MPLSLHILIHEISEVTERRFKLIRYIIQIHDKDVHWLNTILLKKNQIDAYFNAKPNHRKVQFYHILGHALSSLIPPSTPQTFEDYLKNYLTILNGWETVVTKDLGTWTPRMKAFFTSKGSRKNSFSIEKFQFDDEDGINRSLTLPHLPFEPSYTQTVLALCDLLHETYTIITDFISNMEYNRYIEIFCRVDHKIKKILETMAKDIEIYAREMIKKEFDSLLQLSNTADDLDKTST